MGKHRQRNIEMVVGVATPGQAPVVAHLRHAYRTAQGPEVRVRQRDVHCIQHHRMAHFTPVGGDHVSGDRQACRTAEFRHHFTAGISLFRPARIFRIGQHVVQPFAQRDGFVQQPCAVRIHRNARIRKAFFQGACGVDLFFAGQYAAFEFEIFKAIAILCRLCQTHHRLAVHRFLMTQVIPGMLTLLARLIRQIGFRAIADIEQIAQHGNRVALFTRPKQVLPALSVSTTILRVNQALCAPPIFISMLS